MTFDGADGWAKGSILSQSDMCVAERRQQRNGSVIIWAETVNQTIIGLLSVDAGVKLNSANYYDFMNKTFITLYQSQSCSFKVKCVFMYDNATSHIYKLTQEILNI